MIKLFCWFEHVSNFISSVNSDEVQISTSVGFTHHSLQQTGDMSSKSCGGVQQSILGLHDCFIGSVHSSENSALLDKYVKHLGFSWFHL